MSSSPQAREWLRIARRQLGRTLIAGGAALVAASALAAGGWVPLWRPSVPAPPYAVQAGGAQVPAARAAVASAGEAGGGAPGDPPAVPVAATPTTVVESLWDFPVESFPMPVASPTVRSVPTPRPSPSPRLASTAWPSPTPWPSITPRPSPTLLPSPTVPPSPTPPPTPVPAPPAPGLPIQLAIPSIRLNTPVVALTTHVDDDSSLEWETVPFVAGYYGVTGLVGARANVIVSGHVSTQGQGNVFRELYLLRPGEPIVVYTADGEFTYQIERLQLVKPEAVAVLAPTGEPQLTLVTCAGEFDFRTRSFTDRLVVVGKLVAPG